MARAIKNKPIPKALAGAAPEMAELFRGTEVYGGLDAEGLRETSKFAEQANVLGLAAHRIARPLGEEGTREFAGGLGDLPRDLLRALGAEYRQVLGLFLGEAVVLAAIGGVGGLVIGGGLAVLIKLAVPALPIHTSVEFVVLALGMAAVIGLIAGVLPARRAASLEPVDALRTE